MKKRNGVRVFFLFVLLSISLTGVLKNALSKGAPDPRFHEVRLVEGDSMTPFLPAGSSIELDRWSYLNAPIEQGDLILFQTPHKVAPLVKWVKAAPGDHFEIRRDVTDSDWSLWVNGRSAKNSLGDPYRFDDRRASNLVFLQNAFRGEVPAGSYLVLGDAIRDSLDSALLGFVAKSAILGKARKVDFRCGSAAKVRVHYSKRLWSQRELRGIGWKLLRRRLFRVDTCGHPMLHYSALPCGIYGLRFPFV